MHTLGYHSKVGAMKTITYPWPLWFRKKRFHLRRGTHFDLSLASMEAQVRNAAHKVGLYVSIRTNTWGLTVTVTGGKWIRNPRKWEPIQEEWRMNLEKKKEKGSCRK